MGGRVVLEDIIRLCYVAVSEGNAGSLLCVLLCRFIHGQIKCVLSLGAKELTWHVLEFFLAWVRVMYNTENKAGKR